MEDTRLAWWKDTAERLVWTFVQGATGLPLAAALGEATGWIDLGNPNLWDSMITGGVMAVLAFLKSVAADRLSAGGTAQLGAHTYSYTTTGPGAAGGDLADAGAVTLRDAMIFVALGLAIVALVIWIF